MRHIQATAIILCALLLFCHQTFAADTDQLESFGSVEERRLKENILQERATIRKEREEIALRKNELKTLEEGVDKKLAEIDNKLDELQKLQNKIQALLAEKSAVEKKRLKDLAGIYQKMSPNKAALALTGLEKMLAADLLANMKTKSAAKILDEISKQKAVELSTSFTTLQLE